jgi:hypothetical protein
MIDHSEVSRLEQQIRAELESLPSKEARRAVLHKMFIAGGALAVAANHVAEDYPMDNHPGRVNKAVNPPSTL